MNDTRFFHENNNGGRKVKFKIEPNTLDWWFWALTLICMISGLSGAYMAGDDAHLISRYGFYGVITISWIQVVYFVSKTGVVSFPSQVRWVYATFVTIALFDPTLIFYWMLLVGTFMVTFFGRCIIARVLVMMPWNKGVKLTP